MNKDELLSKIKIVDDDESEQCDFLVCTRADFPSPFDDNLTGFCAVCGTKVQFRWHAPRKPKRICMECMFECAMESKK